MCSQRRTKCVWGGLGYATSNPAVLEIHYLAQRKPQFDVLLMGFEGGVWLKLGTEFVKEYRKPFPFVSQLGVMNESVQTRQMNATYHRKVMYH
jgi:hypothetical protein